MATLSVSRSSPGGNASPNGAYYSPQSDADGTGYSNPDGDVQAPRHPNPSLEQTGILLPKVHLGSFSGMDPGYFNNTASSPPLSGNRGLPPSSQRSDNTETTRTVMGSPGRKSRDGRDGGNGQSFGWDSRAAAGGDQGDPNTGLAYLNDWDAQGTSSVTQINTPSPNSPPYPRLPLGSPKPDQYSRNLQYSPPAQQLDYPQPSPRSNASSRPQPSPFAASPGGTDYVSSGQSPNSPSLGATGSPASQLAYLPPGAASPRTSPMYGTNLTNSVRMSQAGSPPPQDLQPGQASPRKSRNLSVDAPTQSRLSGDRSRGSPKPSSGRGIPAQYADGGYAPQKYSPEEQQRVSYSLAPMAPAHVVPSASPARVPVNQASPYPNISSMQQSAYAVQPPLQTARRPAQVVMEEVCVECMMRDRDMADVDVVGPGAWDRESDADYRELVRREKEGDHSRRSTPLSGSQSHENTGHRSRPSARGGRLTEENVKVWLTMNPKEPQARWQTLETYVRSQGKLLHAEAQARAQAAREVLAMESKMRDTYSEIRQSVYDNGGSVDAQGVRLQNPRASSGSWAYNASPESRAREVTLLENGLIVERVDIKQEEKEERARQQREEKARRKMSVSAPAPYAYGNDKASVYSIPSPGMDYGSLSHTPQSPAFGAYPGTPRRMSVSSQLNPPRPSMMRGASQTSIDSTGTGVRRFFGRHFSGASQASLALSGSMMDMHLGLDQDRRTAAPIYGNHDFSAPPSMAHANLPAEPWVTKEISSEPEAPTTHEATVSSKSKKKTNKLGKIWKMVTGHKEHEGRPAAGLAPPGGQGADDDLSSPLAPPPPLSMLVGDRSEWTPPGRSSNPQQPPNGVHHPRSSSIPSQSAMGFSPPTTSSSLLPSPTSTRFPWRDSAASDDRRASGGIKDDAEIDISEERDALSRNSINRTSAVNPSSPRQGSYLSVPPVSGAATPRPFVLDKSLPPLPPPEGAQQPYPTQFPQMRPNTVYTSELTAPNPMFRQQEMRRQSFNGLTQQVVRPTWGSNNTVSGQISNGRAQPPYDLVPPPSIGARYDEFGGSRRSLGKFEDIRMGGNGSRPDLAMDTGKRATKTRSRFGLSALFGAGKKAPSHAGDASYASVNSKASTLPPSLAPSYSEEPFHARSLSHSSFAETASFAADRSNGSVHPRMSTASSKRLGDLVTQSEDFVAYRYPSTSGNLR